MSKLRKKQGIFWHLTFTNAKNAAQTIVRNADRVGALIAVTNKRGKWEWRRKIGNLQQ